MPTEREYSKQEPEHKRDHYPARRLRFLDYSVPQEGSALIIRVIVCVGPVWLILINLMTAVRYIVAVHKSISVCSLY